MSLSLILLTPFLFGVVSFFPSRMNVRLWVARVGVVLTLSMTASLLMVSPVVEGGALTSFQSFEWVPALGTNFDLGLDGVNGVLLVVTNVLFLIYFVMEQATKEWEPGYNSQYLLLLLGAIQGYLLSVDFLLSFLFLELAAICTLLFLVNHKSSETFEVHRKLSLHLVSSSLLLVCGYIFYAEYYEQFGQYSTSILNLYGVSLSFEVQMVLFVFFFLSLILRAGLFPFHSWIFASSKALKEEVLGLLLGISFVVTVFTLMRFVLPLVPEAIISIGPTIAVSGVLAVIYYGLLFLRKQDYHQRLVNVYCATLAFTLTPCFLVGENGSLSYGAVVGTFLMTTAAPLYFLVSSYSFSSDKRMRLFATVVVMSALFWGQSFGAVNNVTVFLFFVGLASVLLMIVGLSQNHVSNQFGIRVRFLGLVSFLFMATVALKPEIFLYDAMESLNHLAENFRSYRLLN